MSPGGKWSPSSWQQESFAAHHQESSNCSRIAVSLVIEVRSSYEREERGERREERGERREERGERREERGERREERGERREERERRGEERGERREEREERSKRSIPMVNSSA